MSYGKVAIIGLGLLGGSIGLAVARHLPGVATAGYDADPAVRARAAERGLAGTICDSAAEAAADADLVILCVPVGAMGDAARAIAGALKPGTAVDLWGPLGDFVLDSGERPLVFAACDLGFAPVKSLIEHALARDESPSLSLFWLATRPDGHFLANQCRAWSAALDSFEHQLAYHSDAAAGARQMGQAMRADLFDIACDFYLAGPEAFVQVLCDELRAGGVPAAQIRAEVVA